MLSSSNALRQSRLLSTAAAAVSTATTTTTETTTDTAATITISRAKSKLKSEHDPDKALKIYSSLADRYTSPIASRYAQDLTVKRLARSHRFSDIENLIESHKNDPKITQEPYLCTLIRSYGLAGMFDHALKTFNQMDELGTPRSAVSFNTLLTACNQAKLFDRVPDLFEEISKKYGIAPNRISYGVLVKSYCELGKPEMAIERLKEMEEKEIEVTAITYSIILHSLYTKGRTDEAEKIWSEMVKKSAVDVGAYNVKLMQIQGGDPENVKLLLEEMINFGLKPDTISYNYLMTCYFRNGMIKEAKKVYEDLEGYGCKPNAATFRTLIYYMCRNELFEQGYSVFKESVAVNRIPDFSTLKHLVEGLVKKSKIKDAKALIRTVKKKFPPNLLNAWKKLEVDLGFVSVNSEKDASSGDQGQESSV